MYRKQQRPTVSKKDLTVTKKDLPHPKSLQFGGADKYHSISALSKLHHFRNVQDEKATLAAEPKTSYVIFGKTVASNSREILAEHEQV